MRASTRGIRGAICDVRSELKCPICSALLRTLYRFTRSQKATILKCLIHTFTRKHNVSSRLTSPFTLQIVRLSHGMSGRLSGLLKFIEFRSLKDVLITRLTPGYGVIPLVVSRFSSHFPSRGFVICSRGQGLTTIRRTKRHYILIDKRRLRVPRKRVSCFTIL